MADDRKMVEPAERPLGLLERLTRDVDQMDPASPPEACSASARMTSFSPLPQPSSTNCGSTVVRTAQQIDDVDGVRSEQPPFGARDAIPRQPADGLEQARAERVVEILGLQLFRREREVPPHVGSEVERELID